jgi:RecB family endonuclease NucS
MRPGKTYAKILRVGDFGCTKHRRRELTLYGTEADLMEIIINNLQREGEFHTFVCREGHTHRLRVRILGVTQKAI